MSGLNGTCVDALSAEELSCSDSEWSVEWVIEYSKRFTKPNNTFSHCKQRPETVKKIKKKYDKKKFQEEKSFSLVRLVGLARQSPTKNENQQTPALIPNAPA